MGLISLQHCSCSVKTRQCYPTGTGNGTIERLVPPLEWDGDNGSTYNPALVHLGFDIWDIQRVDDATQSLLLMVTFSERWTDDRLQEYCKKRAPLDDLEFSHGIDTLQRVQSDRAK